MDLWMKILAAVLLVMMLVFLFPRARQMITESPKGSGQDWMAAVIPLALVAGFVILLIALV
jgi:hypothetical protein